MSKVIGVCDACHFELTASDLKPGDTCPWCGKGTLREPNIVPDKPKESKPAIDQWGVGNKADAKPFTTVKLGGQECDLIMGEHPHSRRDSSEYLRTPNGTIYGFDGFRHLIDIRIKSSNYLKESGLSGDEVRKAVEGKVFVDGVQLVSESGRDPIRMMRHLERLIEKFSEHESQWFNAKERQKLIGRKVWYHDQPAEIIRVIEDQGCVVIKTEPGHVPPRWANDDDDDEQYNYWDDWKVGDHYEVKDDVLSPHIYWFRS